MSVPGRTLRGSTSRDDFTISSSGALSFSASPDYENPTDDDTNNWYVVTVEASATDRLTEVNVPGAEIFSA